MFKQNFAKETSVNHEQSEQDMHQDNAPLNKSNTEILDEIDTMLEAPHAEFELDTVKLKQYLELLQERAPVAQEYEPGTL